MDAVGKRKIAVAMLMLVSGLGVAPRCEPADDLHAQSAAAVFQEKFTRADLSYLALDGQGQIVAQRWDDADRVVPVGSLVKPFLAVAYGRGHGAFPQFHCAGKKTCWLPRGHGTLGITRAIAFSCNSYFRQLAARAGPDYAAGTLKRFGLSEESDGLSGSASPAALAHAYAELATLRDDRAVEATLRGMALSARIGTGKAAGAALPGMTALTKTGTAPCTHAKKAPGDGFAVVMAPADHPRIVLLVRLHGQPGASAAKIAGEMLAAVENAGGAK